jgi:hypothetical protein
MYGQEGVGRERFGQMPERDSKKSKKATKKPAGIIKFFV